MHIHSAQNKKHKAAIIYILIATLIWGAAGPIIKYTLSYIPPFTFLFLRFLVATIAVLPILILEERNHPVSKKDWVNLVIVSFLGGTLTLGFVFLGFNYTTSLDGSLISAVAPIFILLASSLLLKENITHNEKKGSLIALAGTILITLEPLIKGNIEGRGVDTLRLWGNFLVILSVVAWTLYTIWSKKIFDHKPSRFGMLLHYFHLRSITKNYSPIFLTAVLCVVSLLSFAPLAFLEVAYTKGIKTEAIVTLENILIKPYETPKFGPNVIYPLFGVLYMGLFSTLVAYGMYEWAIKEMPVAESAIFSYLQPIFTIPFAYILLGEKVSLWFMVGGLIIGFGVYISEKKT